MYVRLVSPTILVYFHRQTFYCMPKSLAADPYRGSMRYRGSTTGCSYANVLFGVVEKFRKINFASVNYINKIKVSAFIWCVLRWKSRFRPTIKYWWILFSFTTPIMCNSGSMKSILIYIQLHNYRPFGLLVRSCQVLLGYTLRNVNYSPGNSITKSWNFLISWKYCTLVQICWVPNIV